MSRTTRRSFLPAALATVLAGAVFGPACQGRAAGAGEDEGETETGDDEGGWVDEGIYLSVTRDVDILFVIDNSASMGREQGALARSLPALVDALGGPEIDANYRVAFTTTDADNPRCDGTSPERGAFVYSSCVDRLAHFVSQDGVTDASAVACTQQCSATSSALGIGPDAKPWFDLEDSFSTLPSGVSPVDALRCLAPQGIDGCGFESQLESMNLALIRAQSLDQPEEGFIRDQALLAVVHLTDEADCSYQPGVGDDIFLGNQVFWYMGPGALPYSTSAVCWNAGVRCVDNGSGLDCESADYGPSGAEIVDPDLAETNAVLYPVSRYKARVQGIENEKKETDSSREVLVASIVGVPSNGQPYYEPSLDESFMATYGIGPGCVENREGVVACLSDADCTGIGAQSCGPGGHCTERETAVPPVRLADFTAQFATASLYSVCADTYDAALADLAGRIGDTFRPACLSDCAADTDPSTFPIEPECSVRQRIGSEFVEIVECPRAADGNGYRVDADGRYLMPDDATHVCYAARGDALGSTPSPSDDLSEGCASEGYNLEFTIARRPGFPDPGGGVAARCTLSELPQLDCPGL